MAENTQNQSGFRAFADEKLNSMVEEHKFRYSLHLAKATKRSAEWRLGLTLTPCNLKPTGASAPEFETEMRKYVCETLKTIAEVGKAEGVEPALVYSAVEEVLVEFAKHDILVRGDRGRQFAQVLRKCLKY